MRSRKILNLIGFFLVALMAIPANAQNNPQREIPVIKNYSIVPLSAEQQQLFVKAVAQYHKSQNKAPLKMTRKPLNISDLKRQQIANTKKRSFH